MRKKADERRVVITFSVASFLNDLGSNIVHPLWPMFVTSVLGLNTTLLGLIDGIGDALHSISRAISGYLSDKIGRRKPFIWIGYLLGSLARVGYAFSSTWWHLALLKSLDRLGKLRGAPRDAMIAEVSTKKTRGKNFGILRMMDNLGGVCGILISIFLLNFLKYRSLFLLASLPSLIGVLLILVFIKDVHRKVKKKFKLKLLGKRYRKFLIASMLFYLGYFSYSFLLLYANSLGFSERFLPIFYLLFTFIASVFSTPFGKASDIVGRKTTLLLSYSFWIVVLLTAIVFKAKIAPFLAFFFYGLQKAAQEPSERAFISELSPKRFRATGIGTFQMLVGLCALPASLIVGHLWNAYGMNVAFSFSLLTSLASFIALLKV